MLKGLLLRRVLKLGPITLTATRAGLGIGLKIGKLNIGRSTSGRKYFNLRVSKGVSIRKFTKKRKKGGILSKMLGLQPEMPQSKRKTRRKRKRKLNSKFYGEN